jgi:hypothetical protein
MTKLRVLVTAALALTAAAIAAAGCTAGSGAGTDTTNAAASGSPASGAPATSATATASPAPGPTGTYQEQIMAWGRRFAACVRAHGQPDFPDPVYPAGVGPNGPNDTGPFPYREWGTELFPVDKGTLVRALDACPEVVSQMPPAPHSLHPPTAAEMAILRRFSQCMRQHGFADFPDPKADGTFPILNTRYTSLQPPFQNVPRELMNAYLACTARDRIPMRAS